MRMRKKLALLLTSAVVSTSFINNQFALYQNTSYGVVINGDYDLENQINTLNNLKEKLEGPKILSINVRPDQPVYIVGDIHADYASFDFVRNIINQNPGALFVFLGDYVDRGARSVEVFMELAQLKIDHPENIILLAGNHERDHGKISGSFIFKFYNLYSKPVRREAPKLAPIKKDNCFTAIFKSFFGPCAKKLFKSIEPETKVKVDEVTEESNSARGDLIEKYEDVFNSLPLGVVLNLFNGKRIFCTHGGVPVDSSNNPIVLNLETELDEEIIQQLLWNDPLPNTIYVHHNSLRGTKNALPHSRAYPYTIVRDFLSKNNFSCMFRAHQPVSNGFRQDFTSPPNNCSESFSSVPHYTVFSSANYSESDQPASIVRINSNHKNFNVIKFGGEKYNSSMGNNIPDYEEIEVSNEIRI